MLWNLWEAPGLIINEVTRPGIKTHGGKQGGSRGGAGKAEWGRKGGVWVLAHLPVSRPPTPVAMVWHSAYFEKMPACPRWSLPGPQGPPWGRHCIVWDCGQFCFPCFILLDWKALGRSYQSCPRLRVVLSLKRVSDSLVIVMILTEVLWEGRDGGGVFN